MKQKKIITKRCISKYRITWIHYIAVNKWKQYTCNSRIRIARMHDIEVNKQLYNKSKVTQNLSPKTSRLSLLEK